MNSIIAMELNERNGIYHYMRLRQRKTKLILPCYEATMAPYKRHGEKKNK